MTMDPRTALLMASLMSLLNGGVLGLMHRSLIHEVRRSAVDWRIGTLLFAGAGILMALRDQFAEGFILPIAYGLGFFGATLYWRANRSFCGVSSGHWMFVPAILGIVSVYVLSAMWPQVGIRIAIASAVFSGLMLAAGHSLRVSRRIDVVLSRRVLIGVLYGVGGMMLLRAVFFAMTAANPSLSDNIGGVDAATSVLLPILPVVGTTAFLLMCLERNRLALQYAADTDDLTGLRNRRSISRAGEGLFASARQDDHGFAIAVIDIDHFKQINDRYGHARGDAALCHVAEVLKSACPAPHLLGRQGGEEFVALLQADGEAAAATLAEALRAAVDAAPFVTDAAVLSISASIGVGTMMQSDREYDDVLRRADAALYAAKALGRNRVEVGRP
jgi:diguanylate cyclase (GGDEF)-like protein